jgi:hypothetical protein
MDRFVHIVPVSIDTVLQVNTEVMAETLRAAIRAEYFKPPGEPVEIGHCPTLSSARLTGPIGDWGHCGSRS